MTTNADGTQVPKTEEQWNFEDLKKVQLNAKAINMMHCAISFEEYRKISRCKTAKEMWDKLRITHEGTKQVRQTKADMLMHEYELFHMKEDESIDEMFERLSVIVNNLDVLGKSHSDEELVRKVLRSLTRPWLSKISAIQEGRDISTLSYDELRGNLIAYEVTHLKSDEEKKKKKEIALKANKEEENSGSETDECDVEEVTQAAQKLYRMLKKMGKWNKGNSSRKEGSKEVFNRMNLTCHRCRKPGHFKADCPLQRKDHKQRRKAMIASWETDSSSDDEENNDLCFMAKDDNEVNYSNPSYDELMDDFDELLTTSQVILRKHDELKSENKKLRKENACLKLEIEKLKQNVENQDLSRLQAENSKLNEKILALSNDLSKFVNGTENLEKLLGKQKSSLNKIGLGYSETNKNQFTTYKSLKQPQRIPHIYESARKDNQPRILTQCSNCNKRGHTKSDCYIGWKMNENQIIPFLRKTNDAGTLRPAHIKGSRIWIPKNRSNFCRFIVEEEEEEEEEEDDNLTYGF